MRALRAPDVKVWLLSAALAATAAVLWWSAPALPHEHPQLWWPLVALLFCLTERFVVHVPIGRENQSLTFAEVPLVLGLLFLSSTELALAALVGVAVALVVLFRSPPIKTAFNLAMYAVHVSGATVLLGVLLGAFGARNDPLSPAGWAAIILATEIIHVPVSLSVSAAIGIRENRWDSRRALADVAVGAINTLVVTDLALISALIIRRDLIGVVLLAVLGVITFAMFRGYHVQRLRYGRLELLYEFTRSVDQALQDESVLETVQREARTLLRAQHAQVAVCPDPELGPRLWWRPACEGSLLRLSRGRHGESNEALADTGFADAMAAPLREGGRVTGVLIVAGRLDDVSTFDAEDARLFEALAGHASVALANSGLVERVRAAAEETSHLSLHDPLTGLPNRLFFQQRLERRLATTGSAAVLLMDIDRFKEVNDTLGHDVGDQLIQQVGSRLRRLERDETIVARLGGDEFAVLLGDDDIHLEGMVQRISSDLRNPFDLGEVDLDISASIGIAVAPRDGSSAALLLRRAEVAMYDAKRRLAGVARYAPDRDPYSSRRLSLITDLARALDERSLELYYQPQAEPRSGRVTGVEALLRWKHPVWGNVPPDEFIPLAEHTGLIRPLTRFVVETAVRQCAAWREAGTPVVMAANVSMRNLLEAELADVVARLLVRANLPASLLKLEVTESAIVADPERAVRALERLVDLGLSVSVDDFGEGYSSLNRLRNLPVHEVKIDRAFVRHLSESNDDLAIVRAVINLGHDLGLRVVAEGVEDEQTWAMLEELGCDLVQGYLLAKPMPVGEMTGWLAEHFASYATRLRREAEESAGHSSRMGPRPGDDEAVSGHALPWADRPSRRQTPGGSA
ncbi:MAG: hypothetical protein QOJ60_2720 [Actinomycetota bacterium]|nr:hypothetical protein [Actinomycetota bacterium]